MGIAESPEPVERDRTVAGMPLAVFCLLFIRLITGFAIIVLALLGWHLLGWHHFHWHKSLNIAIAIMGGFIVVQTIGSYLWQRVSPTDEQIEAAMKEAVPNPYADAAKTALTTQGVVLGLIALLGLPKLDLTVKIGAASLAAGVLIASAMYLLVARVPPITEGQYFVASLLQSLMLYALGFGLLCVVTGSWSGT